MTQPDPIGAAVAKQIRKYRLQRGWSVRKLAEECTRHGVEITAASLANIERGQDQDAKRGKRRVTVDELMVIAYVLAVPPILLLTPLGEADKVELVPGVAVHPMAARKWIIGTSHFGYHDEMFNKIPGLDLKQYGDAAKPLIYYWNDLERTLNNAFSTWMNLGYLSDEKITPERAEALQENYRGCLGDLARSLQVVAAAGLRPPPIPVRFVNDIRELGLDVPDETPQLLPSGAVLTGETTVDYGPDYEQREQELMDRRRSEPPSPAD